MVAEARESRSYSGWNVGGITFEPSFGRPWIIGSGSRAIQTPEVEVGGQDPSHTRRMVALLVGGTACVIALRYFFWDSPPQPNPMEDLLKMGGDVAKATGVGTWVTGLTYTLASRFRVR